MKKIYCIVASLGLFASCSSDIAVDEVLEPVWSNESTMALRHSFEYEDGTRVSLVKTSDGISSAWKEGDEIGVLPISSSGDSKIRKMKILEGGLSQDTHYAQFTCDGWQLDLNKKYASFYPYYEGINESNEEATFTIDMTSQSQFGDNNVDCLQFVDYMYSTSAFNDECDVNGVQHNVGFDYKHLVAIMELNLNFPISEQWSKIIIENADSNKVFVTKAKLNLKTGKLTPIEKSSSISLDLSYIKSDEDKHKFTFFVAVLPTTTGELCIKAVTAEGAEMMTYVESKTLRAGKICRYTDNHWEVDLGLSVNWAVENVGSDFYLDDGWYFAWGEVEPKTSSFFWEKYKWLSEQGKEMVRSYRELYGYWNANKESELYPNITKYTGTYYGDENAVSELEPEDDAATYHWGEKWRTPSVDEFKELLAHFYGKLYHYNPYDDEHEYLRYTWKMMSKNDETPNFIVLKWPKETLNDGTLHYNGGHYQTRSYDVNDILSCLAYSPSGRGYGKYDRYLACLVRPICKKRGN